MPDFDLIEQHLEELAAALELSSEDEERFRELLDANEFGLAFEILVYTLVADGNVSSPNELASASAIARSMSLDLDAMIAEASERASQQETPLALTTRVRVRRDTSCGSGPWPKEPTGHIAASPFDGAPFRRTQVGSGLELQYWVVFDEPQYDGDGDGPYVAGEVLGRYIERLTH